MFVSISMHLMIDLLCVPGSGVIRRGDRGARRKLKKKIPSVGGLHYVRISAANDNRSSHMLNAPMHTRKHSHHRYTTVKRDRVVPTTQKG